MKFGQTYNEELDARKALMQWHEWFAWRPVKLVDGRFVWLEPVQRCLDGFGAARYKEKPK